MAAPLCLACTVRGCNLPLHQHAGVFACTNGHSFDIARAGYLNLLQPQDRRSRAPGDASSAVAAREHLLTSGIGGQIMDGIACEAVAFDLSRASVVVDLGSGTGDLLATIAHRAPVQGIGIDIAVTAVERAARRFPSLTWVVANADRRLPLTDDSAALITSLHARRNPAECARVLSPGGVLFVTVPAADDLQELRAHVGGQSVERDRATSVREEHDGLFHLLRRMTLRETHHLTRDPLLELLRVTYRGARHSAAARAGTLDALSVTLASELLIFQKR